MSDIDKAMLFMSIQKRHVEAMMKIMPGTANQDVIGELEAIYADYENLLESGPLEFEFYTRDDLRSNMADVLDKIARTYDSLRDEDKAIEYYEKAAASYDAINQPKNAAWCRDNIAKIKLGRGGTIDDELQRLHSKLSLLDEGSLQYITTVVELGELYMKGGDDFAAEQELKKALTQLETSSFPGAPGEKTKNALIQAMTAISSGDMSELASVEELVATRGLYQRIYHSLALIYQETDQLEQAAEWLEKYQQLTEAKISGEDISGLLSSLSNQSEDI